MALVELIMPKMGESIMEATILSWLKKPGDKIEQDESVLEVATDKVDTEIPAPVSGVLLHATSAAPHAASANHRTATVKSLDIEI